ncbi:MAG TPA: 3-isopropylmalate dehydrogenase [Chloroflexota bacterium]|nr:3-isopropylmalate dehydrogenase [Chloroflexota bacterium]
MTTEVRIALVPGDNIGPEVTAEARKTMQAAAEREGLRLEFTTFPWGAQHYLDTGAVMPEEGPDTLATFDAIYLGAMGDPARVPDRVLSWGFTQKVRKRLRQYVNERPVKLWDGVRSALADPGHIDMVVVRENAEGEYTNIGGPLYQEQEDELAIQTSVYTRRGIERVVRYAFALARTRRRHVTSISKANALPFGMVLWDKVFEEVAAEYPDVETRRLNVDAAAMYLINKPATVDVMVCANLFGDILSDEAAALAGGIGLAPGGNVNPERRFPSMFEPIHGSAPDIAGKGVANPLAAILAGAMLLRFVGNGEARLTRAADSLENAVERLLREGRVRTPDLGGSATTAEVGDAICALVDEKQLLEVR